MCLVLSLHTNVVECSSESKELDTKDAKDDEYYTKDVLKLRWMKLTADYYKNHRPNNYYNYVMAKSGRDKLASNNEPYFAEPASERSVCSV